MGEVLVVGAGPVGMMAAAFLRRAGIACDIVDAKDGPVKESRALGIHARTLEFLNMLGLADTFIRAGRATRYMRFHRPDRELFALDFEVLRDITDYPYYLILPQARTEAFLAEHLAVHGGAPDWGMRLSDLAEDDHGVEVTLSSADGVETRRRYRYVIGADGAASAVRALLGIDFAGATYQARFLLAEVELDGRQLATDSTHVFIGDKTTVAVIPQPGRQFRIVGPDFTNGEASAASLDFTQFERFLDQNALFRGWRFHSPSRVMSYRMHKRVANRFRKGRVFLAGDAAHIHSPAGGQGMNTGMHDAVNLAWKLALVIARDAPPALLDRYEAERQKTANSVVAATDKAMLAVTRPNWRTRFLMRAVGPLALRLFQPTAAIAAMAQLKLHYRDAGASDTTTPLQPGDRMPRLRIGRLQSTLDAFDGRHFVLFAFGDAARQEAWQETLRALRRRLPLVCWAIADDRHYQATAFEGAVYFPDSAHAYQKLGQPAAVLCRPDGYVLAVDMQPTLANAIAATDALFGGPATQPMPAREQLAATV